MIQTTSCSLHDAIEMITSIAALAGEVPREIKRDVEMRQKRLTVDAKKQRTNVPVEHMQQ